MAARTISVATVLVGAVLIGAVAGVGSAVTTPAGIATVTSGIQALARATGGRQRAPVAGDHWSGCNDARAAGTAPIYRGEPGYRTGMDGDGDGIACEPYRDGGGHRSHGRRRRH